MELSKYNEKANSFSKSASDIVRQLALAGIAIVWIFKNDSKTDILPTELDKAVFCFIVTLALDFLHYFVMSLILKGFFRYHEQKGTVGDILFKWYLNAPGYILYISKIIACSIAYYFVLSFLLDKI